MNEKRLHKVLQKMSENGLGQMIISDPMTIFYLTGKFIDPGERMLVLLLKVNNRPMLFVNEMFAVKDDFGADVVSYGDSEDPIAILSPHVDNEVLLGVDKVWPARFLIRLMHQVKVKDFVDISPIVDSIRARKDEEERELMRVASRINDQAMEQIIAQLPNRYSEKKMAQILLETYQELGAEGFSFEPIIAYGANGADPHHETDATSILNEGDSIIIDIGCRKDFYCSDMTRTVFYKKADELQRKVYNIVLEANMKAIETVKPGVRFCDIDAAARNHISKFGFGQYFTHRTGHSIGLDVHETGDVSSANTEPVDEGMIFSIEPGIYFPGKFGVRIEDLVLVTSDGCEVLNHYPKDLQIIG
jgi:Xaa-Pro dipeptidase